MGHLLETESSVRPYTRGGIQSGVPMPQEWRVQRPEFTIRELDIVGAYWNGKQIQEVLVADMSISMVRKTLLDTGKRSIKQRIYESNDGEWMPSGSAEIALWMYKYGYLPRLDIHADPAIHQSRPFNDTSIMVARMFLAGHVSSKQLYEVFGGRLSESLIRNIFNGSKYSIAATIYDWTDGTYFPSHKLAACRWMIEHGVIPENVIGEALP